MAYTTIDNPEAYFQTVLYTGNGSSRTISYPNADADLDADMIWIKQRSDATSHTIFDSVRGVQEALFTNNTNAETTRTDAVSAFGTDSFNLGANGDLNANTETHVAWCWKESATAGFDIVAYEGTGSARTVSHSLSAVPHVMHIKNRESAEGWLAYYKAIGATKAAGHLNNTNASHDHTDYFNDVEPTSSVFTVGGGANGNKSGEDNIAYLWTSKQGFSKVGGSYTGNGNADGTFVYTGFRPALVIQKNTSATQGWQLQDNKRLGYNPDNYLLQPHTDQSESALQRVDLLSNGFKVRTTDAGQNASGNNYIYMAFAEAPFVNSKGVPCNAR